MSAAKKNAICGLCAALSVTVLFLLNILTVVSYCIAMTACIPLLFCYIECGKGRGIAVYIVTAVLAHLFVPNLADILLYSVTFGVITLLKIPTDKIKNKVLRWIIKICIFISCDCVYYFLTLIVFDLPVFDDFSILILFGSVILGIFLGIVYDILLSQIIYLYFTRYRKYILKFIK